MSGSNIVAGEPDVMPKPSSGGGELSGVVGAAGGLLQAALSGNLAGALKGMAIEQGKKLAAAFLVQYFSIKAGPKPAKPPWTALGKIAPPGSAFAAAAMEAYHSAHEVPAAPAASGPAAGAGGGSGNAGGAAKPATPESAPQGQECKPGKLEDWMHVDIDLNDLVHTAVAALMMPLALILRPLAWLFPDAIGGLLEDLPKTSAGTGDKTGLGILIGNNDGKGSDTPGVLGIAMSLAHGLLSKLGFDYREFERGQGEEFGHDGKTCPGCESESTRSGAETLGQFLGVISRKLGCGNAFYQFVTSLLGAPSDACGFVAGVWKGTHQKSV